MWSLTSIASASASIALPVVYWIYRSYSLYLGRLKEEKLHVEVMAALHLRTVSLPGIDGTMSVLVTKNVVRPDFLPTTLILIWR